MKADIDYSNATITVGGETLPLTAFSVDYAAKGLQDRTGVVLADYSGKVEMGFSLGARQRKKIRRWHDKMVERIRKEYL